VDEKARTDAARQARAGLGYTMAAQLIWGVQPLFWPLLDAMSTAELLAHRILWSWAVALAIVAARPAARRRVRELLCNAHALRVLAAASVLMGTAWGLYIYGVVVGRVVETSLALFIGPLVTALLGVVVLRERLRPAQWCASGVGLAAVVVLACGYGRFPWLALAIATAVAVYGLLKKRLSTPAAEGMAVEAAFLTLPAAGFLICLALRGDLGIASAPTGVVALVPLAGVLSTLPLVFFAAALSRVPLSTFGLLMYLNPAIQFSLGVWVLHEDMSTSRWLGFALLWVALAVFAADALARDRRPPEDETTRHSKSEACPSPSSSPASPANATRPRRST
jgi:chloramphenicol-sensitive protein RarD